MIGEIIRALIQLIIREIPYGWLFAIAIGGGAVLLVMGFEKLRKRD